LQTLTDDGEKETHWGYSTGQLLSYQIENVAQLEKGILYFANDSACLERIVIVLALLRDVVRSLTGWRVVALFVRFAFTPLRGTQSVSKIASERGLSI